jgi:triacylglycerol lipase
MNFKEALLCSILAQSAYTNRCDEPDFQITAKFDNAGTNTQGLFGVAYKNTFIVAFRGSEETGAADWITDLKFVQTKVPFISGNTALESHYGFIEAYNSVRDAVIKGAKDTPHKKVISVGHSLGGALASLAALDIKQNVPGKTVSCYTFGSPKVGNKAFADFYNKNVPETYRWVNGADMVPNIPPGDYYHVGQVQHLGDADKKEYGWTEVLAMIKDKIDDHFPQNYIKELRTKA